MGQSKEMFMQMRVEEIPQMYDSTFTKKEAIETAKNLVKIVFEDGNVIPEEVLANLARLKWVVDSAEALLRSRIEIFDKRTVLGLEFNYVQGGSVVNFAEDEIYSTIKSDLDARTEQLKLAQKQDVFDAYGNQVPKLTTTPRKSYITIK